LIRQKAESTLNSEKLRENNIVLVEFLLKFSTAIVFTHHIYLYALETMYTLNCGLEFPVVYVQSSVFSTFST